MGKVYPELDDRLRAFITSQPMFFVATAPCLDEAGGGGHVNVSPKGYCDTFAVLDPLTVAYLDLTGSGAETIAHLRQNGRITLMFCSFGPAPKILRIYGRGRAVLPADADWPGLAAYFPAGAAANGAATDAATTDAATTARPDRGNQRAIILVTADRISDSCGYAVPIMELTQERDLLTRWSERRSADDLAAYRLKHNATSIDGLPALD